MAELSSHDLHFVLSNLPRDVRDVMREKDISVGGGFIRSIVAGEPVNDIDMFAPDKATLDFAAMQLTGSRNGKMHKTGNAITVLAPPRVPLQFITRWVFSDLQALVDSFDFTICQAAVKWQKAPSGNGTWISRCADSFYRDLAARRLVYTAPARDEDSGGSILRMRKFLMRGYNIQIDSMAKVIARLLQGAKNSALWQGHEFEQAMLISSLLVAVDPLTVIDGLDLVNEHEKIE